MENITITLEEYRAMIEDRMALRLIAELLAEYQDNAARQAAAVVRNGRRDAPC